MKEFEHYYVWTEDRKHLVFLCFHWYEKLPWEKEPIWLEARRLLLEALAEKDELVRKHNMLYAYRIYLNSGDVRPLPRHRYMFDHLPYSAHGVR